ncbi:UNVERIFIED_CONTAM: hypothetical protein Q9R71_18200 [Actinomycetes bacterium ARC8]|uniref:hypothetical protein n=1 Tax=Glutamicibacter sp. 0426 TaxID=1913445 RepID=UPI00093D3DC7|nr:hypothetical protein [Glutamicibacter sp. 0426]MDV2979105.1 hypothetical protein [Actinomycetes bacterium ARC8]
MRARSVIALSSLALLAAGCSAAPEQAAPADSTVSAVAESSPAAKPTAAFRETAESAETSPATVTEADANVNSGQAWADSKIEMWKENSGIKSTKGFLYPYNLMTSWTSPEPGVIDIKLPNHMVFNRDGMQEPYQGPEDELRTMGRIMFESIGEASPELESVTFATENGKHSGTYTRARTGADPTDREAWANEKYVQWLSGMNDIYESMCHATITKLEVYRDCIPSDPHAYVSKVESPAPGELVVTLADGPWIDGEYDSSQIPGVDFVAGNMILKINQKAHGDEQVKKITVTARDGKESDTELRENWQQ